MDDSSGHFVTAETPNAFSSEKEKIEKATSDFLEYVNEIRSLEVISIKLVWLKIILKLFYCNDRRNYENNMFMALRFIIWC